MYAFERFTERAKKVLTLAQEEAERAKHSYIGTEHLLLGLLRVQEGLAAHALRNLGMDIEEVRPQIEDVLGRSERVISQQIIPTSRVKKVIEMSFAEAQAMGHNYVGTEHMLLGLLIEGEGIAAHVLVDLGATLNVVRAEIERLLLAGPPIEPSPPDLTAAEFWQRRLRGAAAQGDGPTGLDRLLRSIVDTGGTEALARLLDVSQATDKEEAEKAFEQAVEAWREQLLPPPETTG